MLSTVGILQVKKVGKVARAICIMNQSYDATTHFETTVEDVLAMYTAITGKVDTYIHTIL